MTSSGLIQKNVSSLAVPSEVMFTFQFKQLRVDCSYGSGRLKAYAAILGSSQLHLDFLEGCGDVEGLLPSKSSRNSAERDKDAGELVP